MIAKHIPMRVLKKSSFKGLVNYLTDTQGKNERVGQINVTNCYSNSVESAMNEIVATQQMNTRAKTDKAYHLVVSFREGEELDGATLRQIEKQICDGLGYKDHQRISVVHNDTDNQHIHIAINKIHPQTHNVHTPFNDYLTLSKICEEAEKKFGLEMDNHTIIRSVSQGKANDMERHSGQESLMSWIKTRGLLSLNTAENWQELHSRLSEKGLVIKQKGNGFVFEDAQSGLQVKASSIDRALSKSKLEARLGAFESATDDIQGHALKTGGYKRLPVVRSEQSNHLYQQYQDTKNELIISRRISLEKARGRYDGRVAKALRSNRLRRSAIKMIGGSAASRRLSYRSSSRLLRIELTKIKRDYQVERQTISKSHASNTYADWLRAQAINGNADALQVMRGRRKKEDSQRYSNGFLKASDRQESNKSNQKHDSITKKGTVVISKGLRESEGKISVSKGVSDVESHVKEALEIAKNRFGGVLKVSGDSDFIAFAVRCAADPKLGVTFSNPQLEQRRKLLEERLEKSYVGREQQRGQRSGRSGSRTSELGRGSVKSRRSNGRTGVVLSGIGGRVGGGNKSNLDCLGSEPPTIAKNRMRELSELSVVRFTNRSEVLLPSDVSSGLEHQGKESDNALRRDLSRTGLSAGVDAVRKYIAERESKRLSGFDIPNHGEYNQTSNKTEKFIFSGVRMVDGHSMALLKDPLSSDIFVKSIDVATAKKMKSQYRIGDDVYVTPKGSIRKSKGRSL